MKLKEIQYTFHQKLDAIYGEEEVDSFFYILIEAYYNVSRLQLALNLEYAVKDAGRVLEALHLLEEEKPIQYILGETEFYGLPFKVNEHTLIPRPETEELVEWIIKEFKNYNSEIRILDIGTGSGCIAVALAKRLKNVKVYALDISKDALKIARKNAELNDVDIEFIEADILNINQSVFNEESEFDIIVSNPPYVRDKEKELMKANVLNNEPHLALFVKDENPLQFYKAITEFAVEKLNKNGQLFFEINEFLGKDMIRLLLKNNFKNIQLKQDIFKKDRMIKGEKE
ncbi:peptide chain release factor N(5)-glutamine methyltransferase [Thalassobellus suaedae]|uniref:Release factor glutamine methyltransferase n=1 Tax=Thalassobellus suaedae TaxID=3074124 RepID=A0ABY9Y0Q7_9FLAO|nr:peptide chain release factor N(5)-glutamine methyltransferase [Flavobacteriaceae bacterium HL-DH10]